MLKSLWSFFRRGENCGACERMGRDEFRLSVIERVHYLISMACCACSFCYKQICGLSFSIRDLKLLFFKRHIKLTHRLHNQTKHVP